MKILVVHTFYAEQGGEDAVFKNELNLLSKIADVKALNFKNSGSAISVAKKFILAPWNFLALKKFRQTVKVFRPDVIHLHNWYFAASPLIIRAAKKMNIPVVVTLHNYRLICPSATLFHNGKIFTNSLKESFPWTAVKNKVYRNSLIQTFWLAGIVYLHRKLKTWEVADRYIALTDFAKELHLKSSLNLRKDQLYVKGNFVEDNGFNTENRTERFLYVGRLTEDKGLKTLLRAFKNTDFSLDIIGDGPLKDYVAAAAKANPLIIYHGSKPNQDIIKAMKTASALIFPSLWYEGMPMTILEAFSCGTPVIASRLGAMESLITHKYNGLFFKPDDEQDLKETLIKWKNEDALTKRSLSLNARHCYEDNYTAQQNLERLMEIYNFSTNQTINSKVCNYNSSFKENRLPDKAFIE